MARHSVLYISGVFLLLSSLCTIVCTHGSPLRICNKDSRYTTQESGDRCAAFRHLCHHQVCNKLVMIWGGPCAYIDLRRREERRRKTRDIYRRHQPQLLRNCIRSVTLAHVHLTVIHMDVSSKHSHWLSGRVLNCPSGLASFGAFSRSQCV